MFSIGPLNPAACSAPCSPSVDGMLANSMMMMSGGPPLLLVMIACENGVKSPTVAGGAGTTPFE